MAYSALESRAIKWYAEEHDLVPQLSARPTIYFKKRSNGEEVKVQLLVITSDYSSRSRKQKAGN